jgi:hypothetical protein
MMASFTSSCQYAWNHTHASAFEQREGGHTELAKLAVGNNQGSQGTQSVKGLIPVLLRLFLTDGRDRSSQALVVELIGLPDEVLQQIAMILGQQQILGLFHNFIDVCD